MSTTVWYFEHSLVLPFFGIGMKTDLFHFSLATAEFFKFSGLGLGLSGHMVALFLVCFFFFFFKEIPILFSIVAESIYIPADSATQLHFLHILSRIYYL